MSPEDKSADTESADTESANKGVPAELPGAGTEAGDSLAKAHGAFELGDYRTVRALCDDLSSAPEEVAVAARDLRRRTEVDPAQVVVLAGCLVLFVALVWKYVL